ncbi:nicotianamine synthase family protein [Paenibacillus sp. PAMC21692]|uniref:nicotianamine synthase family protein n=1 Tax=Paenibacillus sp. PAMC21692 TaxID=2762320 RepID=UPI00164D19DE|nr:nicotianamine synthase family protein [Paenibacillus sp. PAMC21692]QNK60310.1 nicotianamine synthase [Paenibacillus sp. PAMC21692]
MDAQATETIMNTDSNLKENKIEALIRLFKETNERLQHEQDLSPDNAKVSEIIGRLMSRLRSRYLPEEITAVLGDDYIRSNQRKLQDKLSEAEFLAELNDARQLAHGDVSPLVKLAAMPIWRVYNALVGEELSFLSVLLDKHGKTEQAPIVFVGSGPLPLSPVMLHLFGKTEVVALEKDRGAFEVSRTLLKRMGLESKVIVKLMEGADFNYSAYDVIFVASLVRNKREVLEQISRTTPQALVAVRTAEGIRQIMYEAIDESLLYRLGWDIIGRTSPDGRQVINSTLFLGRNE